MKMKLTDEIFMLRHLKVQNRVRTKKLYKIAYVKKESVVRKCADEPIMWTGLIRLMYPFYVIEYNIILAT